MHELIEILFAERKIFIHSQISSSIIAMIVTKFENINLYR